MLVSRKKGLQQRPGLGVERRAVDAACRPAARAWAALQGRHLAGEDLSALAALRRLSIWLSTVASVGEHQLQLEDAEVGERVGVAGHVVVLEGPQHQADGVGLADAGQEAVAETLPGRRPGDQAGDVDELDGGVHDLAAGAHLGQGIEPVVGRPGPRPTVVSVVEKGWAATGR